MKQPIPGVTPPDAREVASMTVWPTIGAIQAGRLIGKLCGIRAGLGPFLTLGKLFALASIPASLVLYFWQVMPGVCRRYLLTNRRIVVQKGLVPKDGSSIELDQFDDIRVEVLPGQEWLRAGELVFLRDGNEVFRLCGVSRPEVFRQVCLKARTALVSVRETLKRQASSNGQLAAGNVQPAVAG